MLSENLCGPTLVIFNGKMIRKLMIAVGTAEFMNLILPKNKKRDAVSIVIKLHPLFSR